MRICAVDLETTDLKAMMGTLLCGSFQPIIPPEYGAPEAYTIHIVAKKHSKDPNPDKQLAMMLRDEIERYDEIVTWNGKMFDVPFLNARLLKHNERPVRPRFHLDLMYKAGYSANRIGSKKLVNVQKFLDLAESKTDIDWDVWKMAMRGDDTALAEVIYHCEQDVRVLAEVYWRLLPYVKNLHSMS
tara:strand:- start:2638 stop:3195 length:558 start_codon:yes stop_codon:yes gene_type:complete